MESYVRREQLGGLFATAASVDKEDDSVEKAGGGAEGMEGAG